MLSNHATKRKWKNPYTLTLCVTIIFQTKSLSQRETYIYAFQASPYWQRISINVVPRFTPLQGASSQQTLDKSNTCNVVSWAAGVVATRFEAIHCRLSKEVSLRPNLSQDCQQIFSAQHIVPICIFQIQGPVKLTLQSTRAEVNIKSQPSKCNPCVCSCTCNINNSHSNSHSSPLCRKIFSA